MGVRITWEENNASEEGHRIYRSTSPMDPNSLPSPLATVGPNVTQYDDGTALFEVTYYYRVSSFLGSFEQVSDEIEIFTEYNAYDPNVVTDYVAFYELSTNANDATGVYNATALAGVTFPDGVAATFDGSANSYLNFNTDDFGLANDTPVTSCAWVRASSLGAGGQLFTDWTNGAVTEILNTVQVDGDFLRINAYRKDDDPGFTYKYQYAAGAATQVDFDEWFHMAVHWPGDNTNQAIYVNGVSVAVSTQAALGTLNQSGWSGPTAETKYFGRNPDYGGSQVIYQGRAANLRIYDRLLSGAEIETIVAAEVSKFL